MVAWKVAGVAGGRREGGKKQPRELKTHKEGKRRQSFMRTRKPEDSTEPDPDILYSAH